MRDDSQRPFADVGIRVMFDDIKDIGELVREYLIPDALTDHVDDVCQATSGIDPLAT